MFEFCHLKYDKNMQLQSIDSCIKSYFFYRVFFKNLANP